MTKKATGQKVRIFYSAFKIRTFKHILGNAGNYTFLFADNILLKTKNFVGLHENSYFLIYHGDAGNYRYQRSNMQKQHNNDKIRMAMQKITILIYIEKQIRKR